MDTVIIVDPILWSLLVGSIVPIFVALSTKLQASSGVKATIGILLSLIGSIVITMDNIPNKGTFSWRLLAITSATAIIAQVAAYVGAWKPILAINTKAAPTSGIG